MITVARPVDRQELDGGFSGRITVTRAASTKPRMPDLVMVESELTGNLCLTREQAADLAESLFSVSGMASSSRHAKYLAEVHRKSLLRRGISRRRLSDLTGITPWRLRKILAAEVPMTHAEHVAISEASAR